MILQTERGVFMATASTRVSTANDSGHGGLQMLISAGPARFVADEPVEIGGLGLGPSPHDLVSAGLAACTTMTMRLYAKRKGWAVGPVHVAVSHRRDPEATPADHFTRRITLTGDLDEEKRSRLLEIANKCPIHKLLTTGVTVETILTP
jgi:putative redox protein